jgi:hypothetical protein
MISPAEKQQLRAATSGMTVVRVADGSGTVSFAGASYRAGRAWARSLIQVAIVGASVQLSVHGKVIRVHPIRHDRAKEHSAHATPNGRPRKPKTACGLGVWFRYRSQKVVRVPGLDTRRGGQGCHASHRELIEDELVSGSAGQAQDPLPPNPRRQVRVPSGAVDRSACGSGPGLALSARVPHRLERQRYAR